jgi:hypothetical protein
MLNHFIGWAKKLPEILPPYVRSELTVGQETDNSAAILDLETGAVLGRLTCWDSGQFHAEAMDADSERQLLSLHGEFATIESLVVQLREFLVILDIPRILMQT